ncbi:MAG TPA: branched-chain amino acid aminotransferase [Rhizomicrobium sp.]|nr:branched-chain amino acid aminotransferase [Rhizomicrobium sp.]
MAEIIPFDKRDGSIWLDGRLVPWREANVHVLTHGLHYASSVFEGERVYSGRIYQLEEHTRRLFESARILDMHIPYTEEQINAASREVAKAQGFEDAYVRPVVFRGSEQMSVAAPRSSTRIAIAVWQWPSYFDPVQKMKGIRLTISDWRRPAPDTAPWKSKAAGLYMICTISKHKAESEGFHDALMLDYRGLVAEATGANIFFVEEGKLITPIADCFLDGVTRRSIMQLARARQIPVVEKYIEFPDLERYSECFLTGTAAEVTPVQQIAQYRFTPGAITETLMHDYMQDVRKPVSAVTFPMAA